MHQSDIEPQGRVRYTSWIHQEYADDTFTVVSRQWKEAEFDSAHSKVEPGRWTYTIRNDWGDTLSGIEHWNLEPA